jgi:hypothetical protein
LALYILSFADGRDDVEIVADIFRERPPFIEFIAVSPDSRPRVIATYRDDEVVRIERRP